MQIQTEILLQVGDAVSRSRGQHRGHRINGHFRIHPVQRTGQDQNSPISMQRRQNMNPVQISAEGIPKGNFQPLISVMPSARQRSKGSALFDFNQQARAIRVHPASQQPHVPVKILLAVNFSVNHLAEKLMPAHLEHIAIIRPLIVKIRSELNSEIAGFAEEHFDDKNADRAWGKLLKARKIETTKAKKYKG